MSRRRLVLALAVCCLVPSFVSANDIFELMPGDTLGFVVINRLADMDGKLQDLGQRIKLPIPSLVSIVKTKSGITQGVDEAGSISVVFLPTPQGPAAVLYVPVDDYAAFIEQLLPEGTENNITTVRLMGRPVIVGKKNSHAVFAWASNGTLLQKVLSYIGGGQSTSDIVKALKSSDHDVAAGLFSDGVKLLAELGQEGLEEAKAFMRRQSDDNDTMLAGIEVYVQLLNAISSEVATAAVGLQLEDGGSLRVNEWLWVQPNGKIAPALRDLEPYKGDLSYWAPQHPIRRRFWRSPAT